MKCLHLILFLFILLLSCNKKEELFVELEQEPESEEIDSSYVGFNMFFLKDEKLTGTDVADMKLYELELQKTPFVAQGNIHYYDTSSHVIHLFETVTLPEMKVSVYGKPFVVITDTTRHYLGVIWPMYSSASYWGPVIDVAPRFYPHDIVKISMGRAPVPQPDPRLNNTIMETLKDYGIFHAGITCSIDTIEIIENDLINNKCKLSYTITIKNNDEFNLYVFDPLKMGDAYFHYYHNGVYLRGTENLYQSTTGYQIPGSGENPLNWLIKINSKDSITRTLQKPGYPYIPKGSYSCGFNFDGLNSIDKSTREQSLGRVWIGRVTATYSVKFY